MKTKSKDQKIFNKFNRRFKLVFKDERLLKMTENHFNKNGSFVSFLIALLVNRLGLKTAKNNIKFNLDDWMNLFDDLYVDKEIAGVYEKLEINPSISIDDILPQFKCFDNFIDKYIEYLQQQNINLSLSEKKIKSLIKNVFSYILYNTIELKIHYDFANILQDEEYDSKVIFISNNTKLFALAKASIIDCCDDKINDLIVLLLGQSKSLNYDK